VFLGFGFIGYLMSFVLFTMICCCLPCIISVLNFCEDMIINRGAATEAINALVAYKFHSMNICNGDVVHDGGGVLDAATEKERTISVCRRRCKFLSHKIFMLHITNFYSRCLFSFGSVDLLHLLVKVLKWRRSKRTPLRRRLPHGVCVDKWLQINVLCPLCKAEIGSSASVPETGYQNSLFYDLSIKGT
jgi:hypothetical protein